MPGKNHKEMNGLAELVLAGDLEGVKKLVENPIGDVTGRDSRGNTLLHLAVRSESAEVVRYLTERVGMDFMGGNGYGETPWDLARRLDTKEIDAYFADRAGFAYEESFHNPIRRGFFPDPSMVRVGEDYYMVNSTFTYFPCIPVSHSRDLLHWRIIGYAVTVPEYAHLDRLDGGMGYWAPDISYWNGRFYITATLRLNQDMERRRVQMVTSSARPEGPYDEPAFLDIDGIDPSLFHDEDGQHYMLINKGARIARLSEDCRSLASEPELLWYGDCRIKPEGPHLLRRGNYYYLFLAEGGTGMGHRVSVARSENRMGPYEPCPYNPVLTQRDGEALIQCTGHGKPVQMPDGRWCLPYLCLRKPGKGPGFIGRETAIDLLEWTADGWPVVNRGRGPSQQAGRLIECGGGASGDGCLSAAEAECAAAPVPADEAVSPIEAGSAGLTAIADEPAGTPASAADPAGRPVLSPYPAWKGHDWMTPRPLAAERIRREGGRLFLLGQREDLCSRQCRSVFVERQKEFVMSAACRLTVPVLKEGQSLGMVCYYDENSYIKFGVGMEEGALCVLLQEYVGDGYRSSRTEKLPAEDGGEEAVSAAELRTLRDAGREAMPALELETMPGAGEEDVSGMKTGKRQNAGAEAPSGVKTGTLRDAGAEAPSAAGRSVQLMMDVSYGRRSFRWKAGGREGGPYVLSDTAYLASEGLAKGKRFTGATVGVYVHGEFWGEFTDYDSSFIS